MGMYLIEGSHVGFPSGDDTSDDKSDFKQMFIKDFLLNCYLQLKLK